MVLCFNLTNELTFNCSTYSRSWEVSRSSWRCLWRCLLTFWDHEWDHQKRNHISTTLEISSTDAQTFYFSSFFIFCNQLRESSGACGSYRWTPKYAFSLCAYFFNTSICSTVGLPFAFGQAGPSVCESPAPSFPISVPSDWQEQSRLIPLDLVRPAMMLKPRKQQYVIGRNRHVW